MRVTNASNMLFTAVLAVATTAAAAAADVELSSDINTVTTEAVTADMNAESASWQVSVEATYMLPQGFSFSPIYDYGPSPVAVSAVRIQLFAPFGDVCAASIQAIDIAHTSDQRVMMRYTPDARGEIVLATPSLAKMMLHVYQPYYLQARCVVRISVLPVGPTDPTDPTDPSGFELGGSVNYQGGFRSRIEMPIDTTDKITQFWLRIPAFCSGLEVLEAGTVTEGVYAAARPVRGAAGVYAINRGVGSRISAIQLSINGPVGTDCDIPVYLSKALALN